MPNKYLLLIGAGVGLVLVVGAVWGIKRALPAVGQAVNPLNAENVFNQAATGVVSQFAGRPETLGGWLAELFDPSTRAVAQMLGTAPPVVVSATAARDPQFWEPGAFD
jgi:hypothetical protein